MSTEWEQRYNEQTELASLVIRQRDDVIAERDDLRAKLEDRQAPICSLSTGQALHAITCIHHTDVERGALPVHGNCPVCAKAERDSLAAKLASAEHVKREFNKALDAYELQVIDLQAKLATAERERKESHVNGGKLIAEIQALRAELQQAREDGKRLLNAATEAAEALEDHYDGAPDSGVLWMGSHIRDLNAATAAMKEGA